VRRKQRRHVVATRVLPVIFVSNSANLLLLPGILAPAVYSDLRSHRIPNKLIVLGLIVALVFQLAASATQGLWSGLLGAVIGLACFIPFYAMRAMGAGDVKLMAVVGFFMGPSGALYAALFSLITGGLCALGYLMWCGLRASVRPLLHEGPTAAIQSAFVAARLARRDRLPFALPIAVGSMAACWNQSGTTELAAWLQKSFT
jgi:Flp pilus assembly protein protease CpaA